MRGQRCSADYKADVLKLTNETEVGVACQHPGLFIKTSYHWRRAERLAQSEMQEMEPGQTPEQAIKHLTREHNELQEGHNNL